MHTSKKGAWVKALGVTGFLFSCASVLSLSCTPPTHGYVIRFGGAQLAGHPLTELQFKFKELAEQYSNGELEVRVYYANQLGGVSEVNTAVRDGSVTMSMSSITYIAGNYNPKYAITTLPESSPFLESPSGMGETPRL